MSIKPFEENKINTRTIIVSTNLTIPIQEIFNRIECVPYTIVKKKRGRRPPNTVYVDPNQHLKFGDVICCKSDKAGTGIKGTLLRKKKKTSRATKAFKNAIAIDIFLDKIVNFKVAGNGTFQLTGCKGYHHAKACVVYIWKILREITPELAPMSALFIPASKNIVLDLGFKLDRIKFSNFINDNTNYRAIFTNELGYAGVKVKIECELPIEKSMIRKIEYNDELEEWGETQYVPYTEYLARKPDKEREKIIKKRNFTTFMVFHSGEIIMCARSTYFSAEHYYNFFKVAHENRKEFEEVLDD